MQEKVYSEYREEDEITLKELILKIKEFASAVIRSWLFVSLVALLCAGIFAIRAYMTPLQYDAELTFMMNDNEGNSGGLGSLLGQLGFGGGGSESGFNIEKMIELAQSRSIASLTLFEKIEVNRKKDFIANHVLEIYNFKEDWEDSDMLRDFSGFSSGAVDSFDRVENAVLKSVHRKLVNGAGSLVNISSDEETGILTLNAVSLSESLSLETAEIFYSKLENYYVQKSINKQQETYNLLKNRTDSLESAMNSTQRRLLRFEDRNRNLGLREYESDKMQLKGELTILQLAFGETYKNLQLAEFSLQNKTPMISVIDRPVFPLKMIAQSPVKYSIIGLAIGAFLATFFVIFRKIYRDTMQE